MLQLSVAQPPIGPHHHRERQEVQEEQASTDFGEASLEFCISRLAVRGSGNSCVRNSNCLLTLFVPESGTPSVLNSSRLI